MSSNQDNASRWLSKKITEAKGLYIIAAVFTILSAVSFIAFCWYLSQFATSWLDRGLLQPHPLLSALVFLTARYIFAHFASIFNYKAGNTIVSKVKKNLYPILLNNNKLDSVA
ncbi:hypothetical protein LDB17_13545, partial [Dysgonomonas sp. Shenzhen-Wh21]